MEILDKVKLILFPTENYTKDEILTMLIEDAKVEAIDYCNLLEYNIKLDSTIVKMVIQNYNKSITQGIASESFSGVSESYINGYTSDVISLLNKNRKVKFL